MDERVSPFTAQAIIRVLGGATQLSRHVNVGRSAVANWVSEGIPARHWPAIARYAASVGHPEITVDVLEQYGRLTSRPEIERAPEPAEVG